jgi:hypothetical protein
MAVGVLVVRVVETDVDPPSTTAGREPGPLTLPQWFLLGEATLPLLAMLTLNIFRPDLMSAFLGDPVGRLVGGAVVLAVVLHATLGAFFFARVNRRFPPGTRGRRWRLALIAGGCLFFLNLPATFAILFGPIAVALFQTK